MTLWKVKAKKNRAPVAQGMEVEVIINGRTGEPSQKDISDAFEKKYGIKTPAGMPNSEFEIKKG